MRTPMRTTLNMVAALAIVAVIDGAFIAHQMSNRASAMNAQNGTITIRADGFLNSNIEIFDSDPNADLLMDLQVVREHQAAYRKLGFTTVRINTLHESITRSLMEAI